MKFIDKIKIEIESFNRGGERPRIVVTQPGCENYGGIFVESGDDYIMFRKPPGSTSPYDANGIVVISHIKSYTVQNWGFAIRI